MWASVCARQGYCLCPFFAGIFRPCVLGFRTLFPIHFSYSPPYIVAFSRPLPLLGARGLYLPLLGYLFLPFPGILPFHLLAFASQCINIVHPLSASILCSSITFLPPCCGSLQWRWDSYLIVYSTISLSRSPLHLTPSLFTFLVHNHCGHSWWCTLLALLVSPFRYLSFSLLIGRSS